MEHLEQLRQYLASWGNTNSMYESLEWWSGYVTGAKLPDDIRQAGVDFISDQYLTLEDEKPSLP